MSHTLDFKSLGSNKDAGSNWSSEFQSALAQTTMMTFGSERKCRFTKHYCQRLLKLSSSPSSSELRSSHSISTLLQHPQPPSNRSSCFTNWDRMIRDCHRRASLLLIDKTISNPSQASPCHQYAHLQDGQYAQEPSRFVNPSQSLSSNFWRRNWSRMSQMRLAVKKWWGFLPATNERILLFS